MSAHLVILILASLLFLAANVSMNRAVRRFTSAVSDYYAATGAHPAARPIAWAGRGIALVISLLTGSLLLLIPTVSHSLILFSCIPVLLVAVVMWYAAAEHDQAVRRSKPEVKAKLELLEESLDLLHGLRESVTGMALVAYDGRLRYLWYSADYAALLGVDPPDVGAYHWDVFSHVVGDRPDWDVYIEAALAGRTFREDHEVYTSPEGEDKVIWWECGPWHRRDGAIGGFYILHGDVSEAHREVKRLQARVDEKVQEIQETRRRGWNALMESLEQYAPGETHPANP